MKNQGNWSKEELVDVIEDSRERGLKQISIDQEHTDHVNDKLVELWLKEMGLTFETGVERTTIILSPDNYTKSNLYEIKKFSQGYIDTLTSVWDINVNEDRTEITLELDTHCRMKINYGVYGDLLSTMSSLMLDNEIEKFSQNAKLLDKFSDFLKTAKLIDLAEKNFKGNMS